MGALFWGLGGGCCPAQNTGPSEAAARGRGHLSGWGPTQSLLCPCGLCPSPASVLPSARGSPAQPAGTARAGPRAGAGSAAGLSPGPRRWARLVGAHFRPGADLARPREGLHQSSCGRHQLSPHLRGLPTESRGARGWGRLSHPLRPQMGPDRCGPAVLPPDTAHNRCALLADVIPSMSLREAAGNPGPGVGGRGGAQRASAADRQSPAALLCARSTEPPHQVPGWPRRPGGPHPARWEGQANAGSMWGRRQAVSSAHTSAPRCLKPLHSLYGNRPPEAQAPHSLLEVGVGRSGLWGAPGTPTPQWAKVGWPEQSDASPPPPLALPPGWGADLRAALPSQSPPQNCSESNDFEGTRALQARAPGTHEGALIASCQRQSPTLPWHLQTGSMAKAPSPAPSL